VPNSNPPVSVHRFRYSTRIFPHYRFIPGQTPHPRRHPQGHSFGLQELPPPVFDEDDWSASADYLYAVDLYNFGYWWESHEVFEGLWHACGHSTKAGNFFQALIQLAGANLKHLLGRELAVRNLTQRGIERLQKATPRYMGIDTLKLAEDFRRWLNGRENSQVLIQLESITRHHSVPERE
jgi:predicted metal-dependent hydrolase